jgi:hypothetical protein
MSTSITALREELDAIVADLDAHVQRIAASPGG